MKLLTLQDFSATGWHVDVPQALAVVNGILATQQAVFDKSGITQDIQIVHLMAQLSHESGGGASLTESLNYQPAALLRVWPSHFTPALAQLYGRTADHPADQRMIGILAYGGRMGNAPAPSEDGYNYRGRGLIQTTGKKGYDELGRLTGLDLLNSPDLVSDPEHAFDCAVTEFVNYPGMLGHCERDDLLSVSALINIGHLVNDPAKVNGYAERTAQLALWKHQYGF
jgi:putative chitinase